MKQETKKKACIISFSFMKLFEPVPYVRFRAEQMDRTEGDCKLFCGVTREAKKIFFH